MIPSANAEKNLWIKFNTHSYQDLSKSKNTRELPEPVKGYYRNLQVTFMSSCVFNNSIKEKSQKTSASSHICHLLA